MKRTAIVLAAGQGKRMNSSVQKQFLMLKGKPLLYYSLACFQNSKDIDEIILVTGRDSIDFCKKEIIEMYGFTKVKKCVAGGKERYDSVYQGLLACEDCQYVFIHDGARPFVSEEIISRAKEAVEKWGACVVGMPSKDTVKLADNNHFIAQTPKRSQVWNVQTPQAFSYTLITEAYQEAFRHDMKDITDDAMIVENYGKDSRIALVEGSYENIKITTPEDILVADRLAEKL
ncbi:MAG TPA: 2-C-methyl-D-erythritol 4-phosphate cytidylyltransferase [Candidatus Blautia pullicola]|uniref:2-C-methyl-D-erythritol 4-phosphate cytidylyltransferase n=1 Tax=Candidatus Blautia pullicola TaxID=2838498 RepID=A0A9D2FTD7_9FIRM|nr:2-C-methyl-D-erythritol 4-phosphate cytidylyltransferase [Candidatus Blautia pullicola]